MNDDDSFLYTGDDDKFFNNDGNDNNAGNVDRNENIIVKLAKGLYWLVDGWVVPLVFICSILLAACAYYVMGSFGMTTTKQFAYPSTVLDTWRGCLKAFRIAVILFIVPVSYMIVKHLITGVHNAIRAGKVISIILRVVITVVMAYCCMYAYNHVMPFIDDRIGDIAYDMQEGDAHLIAKEAIISRTAEDDPSSSSNIFIATDLNDKDNTYHFSDDYARNIFSEKDYKKLSTGTRLELKMYPRTHVIRSASIVGK